MKSSEEQKTTVDSLLDVEKSELENSKNRCQVAVNVKEHNVVATSHHPQTRTVDETDWFLYDRFVGR